MKFIDEKGRLFGVINVFDLFVLCLIAIVAIFALKWTKIADDPPWVKVRLLHVRCIGVMQFPSFVVPLVKEGDETVDVDNVVMLRLDKILSNEAIPVATYVSESGETLFYNKDARIITAEFDVSAYEKKGDIYVSMTNEPLRIGTSLALNTKKYNVTVSVRKLLY